jgi:AraC-like DNA-binding protein
MRPLFERQTILHSRDFDQARAFLASRAIDLRLPGAARGVQAFEVRFNGVYFPGLWIGYIAYGAEVTVEILPQRGDYWVQMPLQGRLEASHGTRRLQCDRSHGAVNSPNGAHVIRSETGATRLGVCIHADALARHLAVLLDDAPDAPLEFAPEISLERGYGASLARVLHCAARDFGDGGWLGDPLTAARFEDFILTGLLFSQPSNYSRALHKRARPIAPRDVRRAVEYIHANLTQELTLGDLVRECGVAGRTLLKHFQDFKGISPMRYLRNQRLQRAREALQHGDVRQVSEAVSRCGFAHPGRFSIEYRRRFGESPSQTLARAKSA